MKNKISILNHYKNKKMFFLWDILALILIISAVVLSIFLITDKSGGEYVEIYYKGELLEVHNLSENKTIEIEKDGHNTVVIENRTVYVSHADCPDKLCVKSPPIKYNNQRIVCAPNGIVIIIKKDDNIDGISGGVNEV